MQRQRCLENPCRGCLFGIWDLHLIGGPGISSYGSYCWWFRNPAFTSWGKLVVFFPIFETRFETSVVKVVWDFWTINSLNSYLRNFFGKGEGATRVYASFRKQGDVVGRFSPQSASTACQDEQWWTCILQHQHLNIKKDTTITIFGDLPGFSKHMSPL